MPSIPNVREQHSATQRSPVPARLFDRILGFDFFISYSHADAQSYAERLNQALLGAGFKAFLDNEVYVAGDDLNTETLRRVRSSSKLIVVGSERVLDAHCLAHIARYKRPRRYVVVDALPKNHYGKLLKTVLRDRLRDAAP